MSKHKKKHREDTLRIVCPCGILLLRVGPDAKVEINAAMTLTCGCGKPVVVTDFAPSAQSLTSIPTHDVMQVGEALWVRNRSGPRRTNLD